MRRDMDLIRKILLEVENSDPAPPGHIPIEIEGRDSEEVSYHVLILWDAGLLEAVDASTQQEMKVYPQRLTWEGHEFLEQARDDTVWRRAKDHVGQRLAGMPFDVLVMVLKEYGRQGVFGDGGGA